MRPQGARSSTHLPLPYTSLPSTGSLSVETTSEVCVVGGGSRLVGLNPTLWNLMRSLGRWCQNGVEFLDSLLATVVC